MHRLGGLPDRQTTTASTTPVTVITQCNGAGLGGASTVTCTVTVTNNLSGYPVGRRAIPRSCSVKTRAPSTLTCVATPPATIAPARRDPAARASPNATARVAQAER